MRICAKLDISKTYKRLLIFQVKIRQLTSHRKINLAYPIRLNSTLSILILIKLMSKTKQTGLTLIELMVTLAVIGVLASAVIAMGPLFQTNQMSVYTQDLINTLNLAKSEAVTRNSRVTVCRRIASPKTGNAEALKALECDTKATNWNNGWIVFVDVKNDGKTIVKLDPPADPYANIIHVQGPLRGSFSLSANNKIAENVSFTPAGFPRKIGAGAGAGFIQNGTFLVCGPRGYEHSRKVVISGSGRFDLRAPSDGEDYNVGDKTCP